MSSFGEVVQQERARLQALISEAKEQIANLLDQVAADEQRIEALDAYERVKVGRTSPGKGSKKTPKRQRSPATDEAPEEPANE